MTQKDTTPNHWTAAVTEPPEQLPDSFSESDGPFGWINDNTNRKIWIEKVNLKDFDEWIITGENSIIDDGSSFDEAQEAAYNFMEEFTHPTSMI